MVLKVLSWKAVITAEISPPPTIADPEGNAAGVVAGSAAHALITDPAGNVAVCADAGSVANAAQEAPKTAAPFSRIPAHYMAFKERARQEDEERRKQQEAARADPARYPGGQIPMNELQPDKVNIDQGPMEVLRFGRIPGSRGIRRIS